MTANRIEVGQWIDLPDGRQQVVGLRGTRLLLRGEDGMPATVLASVVYRAVADATPKTRWDMEDLGALASDLPPRQAALLARRVKAIRAVLSPDAEDALAEAAVRERALRAARELGLSVRQVERMLRAFRDRGPVGLVDQRAIRMRSPLAAARPEVVEAIVAQARVETWQSTGGFDRFKARVVRRLREEMGDEAPDLPPNSTLRRWTMQLTKGEHTFGPATTRQTKIPTPENAFARFVAYRPGELVIFDSTPLDVLAFDPVTGGTFTVELTAAMDLATRRILAFRLVPGATRAVDAALLLGDILTPRHLRDGWVEATTLSYLQGPRPRALELDERLARQEAEPVVWPETILIDAGKVYVSWAFRDGVARYGINLQQAHLYRGVDKANIERHFRTLRTGFSQHCAGFKGNSVANRGVNPELEARWTLEELEEFLEEWVLAVYNSRPHSSLRDPRTNLEMSPNEAYAAAIAAYGYLPVPPDFDAYYELLPTEWRTIQPGGVEIDYLVYNDDCLGPARLQKTSNYPSGKWPFRKDPRDARQIYFKDGDGRWHAVRWVELHRTAAPFSANIANQAVRVLAQRAVGTPLQSEIAAEIESITSRIGAEETWKVNGQKGLRRAQMAAQRAARDRARAATDTSDGRPAAHPSGPIDVSELPTLAVVDFDADAPFAEGPER